MTTITAAGTPLVQYTLRLADNALVLGHRLSEWCGHAPMLEEDIALANIALDLIGQARSLYAYAAAVEGEGRDEDALAYLRDAGEYRNVLLVEQPNGDFAQTIARQFLFSNWQELLMKEIAAAADPRLSAIGAKAVKEIAYHAKFASAWVVRLGDGTRESRARMIAGLDWMWRFVDELFDPKVGTPSLRAEWDMRIARTLAEARLEVPRPRRGVLGGRAGHHSEYLGHLLTEMQFLQRAYPGATW